MSLAVSAAAVRRVPFVRQGTPVANVVMPGCLDSQNAA